MTKAVFLPTPIDPYVDLLWLEVNQHWFDKVDTIYVLLNGDTEKPVVDYIRSRFEAIPNSKVEYFPGMLQHGTSLATMTKKATEDLIMFIEDDAFIFKKGWIETMFNKIEYGDFDMVGSPRVSSSMDIQRITAKRFNIDLSKHGDAGVAFWPNFFFCKRTDLLRTDLDFNAKGWMKGNYIKELDWTVQPDEGDMVRSDTFVWGSIQMRALNLRVAEVPQYHLHPFWEDEKRDQVNVFDGKAGWMHAGSLSGSMYGIITDEQGNGLAFRGLNLPSKGPDWKLPQYANTDAEKREFEKRCGFYILALERNDNIPELADFRKAYEAGVERIIEQFTLDKGRIYAQKDAYLKLFKENGALE